jgi:HlyD family secretion protein
MSAQAIIQVAQHNDVLLVPQVAIKRQGRDSVVQVQDPNGASRTVTIEVGLSDGTNSEVVSGLNEGDQVLVPAAVAARSRTGASGSGAGGLAPPDIGIPGGVR